jgi:hypothetical protein
MYAIGFYGILVPIYTIYLIGGTYISVWGTISICGVPPQTTPRKLGGYSHIFWGDSTPSKSYIKNRKHKSASITTPAYIASQRHKNNKKVTKLYKIFSKPIDYFLIVYYTIDSGVGRSNQSQAIQKLTDRELK